MKVDMTAWNGRSLQPFRDVLRDSHREPDAWIIRRHQRCALSDLLPPRPRWQSWPLPTRILGVPLFVRDA